MLIYSNIDTTEVVEAWQDYLSSLDNWQDLIRGITPKETGCGLVYELENPLSRTNESFAIADMSYIRYSEPHYHVETELYFVLQGAGLFVTGGKEKYVKAGGVVILPSNIAHFTIPDESLVLAVVNTPPFQAANYIPLTQTNLTVHFDQSQFERLIL